MKTAVFVMSFFTVILLVLYFITNIGSNHIHHDHDDHSVVLPSGPMLFPDTVQLQSATANTLDLFPQFTTEHPCGKIGESSFYWQRSMQPMTFEENPHVRYLL